MSTVLPFGPYRGRPVDEVAVLDPEYLAGLVAEGVGSARVRADAARALAVRGHLREHEVSRQHRNGSPVPRTQMAVLRRHRRALLLTAAFSALVLLAFLFDRRLGPAPPPSGTELVYLDAVSTPTRAGSSSDRGRSSEARAPASPIGESRAVLVLTAPPGTPAPCGQRTEGAIDAASAASHLDEFQAVEFQVVRTKDTGRVTFLNSHDPFQGYFYVAVFPSDYDRFPEPPAQLFRGRCVVVQGVIELYKGAPQIVLRSPDDIRIVPP